MGWVLITKSKIRDVYYITTVIYVSGKIDLLCFRFDLSFILFFLNIKENS